VSGCKGAEKPIQIEKKGKETKGLGTGQRKWEELSQIEIRRRRM
jgi:hypothetical protein